MISKRFNYYYGAGLSAGVEESFVRNPDTREIIQTYGNRTTGMDFIVGVEMTLLNVTVSVDYKPISTWPAGRSFSVGRWASPRARF
ncbi:hypothetical protein A3SI_06364 [Nitritalea halalkaliphila LW7]|uniref:Uncharacterized protein n=1 Tax=Nitritalea halalkaliphila LW7 TaxID=1189621 RepID=I5C6W1_9BACT|nr:hypothetical protein A3SI_06364 [Nitritalea halalkaliphila LW7]